MTKLFNTFQFLVVLATVTSLTGCSPNPKRVEQADVKYKVGQNLFFKGDETRALGHLLEAERLNPKDAEMQNFLGLVYLKRNLLPQAEIHFVKAVRLDAKFSEAHNHLCALYSQMNSFAKGLAHCHKAVANILYATPERAYHNMGMIYYKQSNFNSAQSSFLKALNYNERFVLSWKMLGKLYADQEKLVDAEGAYRRAAKVCLEAQKGAWSSECPEAHYQLAMIYIKMRERAKAIDSLNHCMSATVGTTEYSQKCREHLRLYR